MNMYSFKKSLIVVLLTMFLIVSLFLPKTVKAFDFDDIPNTLSSIWERIVVPAWEKGGAIAYKNAINLYLGQIARQTAEWVATGGKGQKPMFLTDPSYWTKLADSAMGEWIDQTVKDFTGRSLCDPFDPTIRLRMLISLDPKYREMEWEHELKCPLSRIKQQLRKATKERLFEFSVDIKEGPVGRYKSDLEIIMAQDSVLNITNQVCYPDDSIGLGDCVIMFGQWPVNQGVKYLLEIDRKLEEFQQEFEHIVSLLKLEGEDPVTIVEEMNTFNEELIRLIEELEVALDAGVPENNPIIYWKDQEIEKVEDHLKELKSALDQATYLKSFKRSATQELEDLKQRLIANVWGVSALVEGVGSLNPEDLLFWKDYVSSCAGKSPGDFCDNQACGKIIFELALGTDGTDCSDTNDYTNALAYTKRANQYVRQLVDWANTLEEMIEDTKPSEEELAIPDLDPLEDINRMYSPEGSDIGVLLKLESDLMREQAKQVEASKFFKTLQGRMNDVTSKISGLTLTPSTLVSEATRQAVEKGSAGPMQYTGVAVADAISVFTNTLVNKLLKQIFETGYNPFLSPELATRTTPFLTDLAGEGEGTSPFSPTQQESQVIFADLTTAAIRKGGEMTIYDEFAVCPENDLYALPMNCLLDDNAFLAAVEEGLSIQQAMDKGWLNKDAIVGEQNDHKSLLSLTKIKKLRRARIFPLGLEIAAQKIWDRKIEKHSLKEIVAGFNQVGSLGDCTDLNGSFETDIDSDGVPDGWGIDGGRFVTDQTRSKHGSKVARIDTKYGGPKRGDIPLLPNTDYTFSVWAMNQDETEHTIAVYGSQFKGDSGRLYGETLPEESDYLLVSFTFNTSDYGNPPTSKDLRWEVADDNNNFDDGKVYFDAIQFIKGSIVPEEYITQDISPFCRLVDPNWILKASTYQCDAIGYSAVPLPESSQRQETCIDLKDCIHENEDGQCDTWSYCTREKNIWRFTGDKCEEQYGSCQTYRRLKDNKQFSYLSKTLDFAQCDQDNVGCQWYCTDWDETNNTWGCLDGPETGKSIFFNSQVEKCSSDAEGCNEYIRVASEPGTEDKIYLQNPVSCEEKDTGCQIYTPANADPVVPGVTTLQDTCPAECVGYETFKQMPTHFDSTSRMVNFIPETGQSCSVPGCEEFTNLETEKLEYYSYLRQCVKLPDEASDCDNYYTWVGSETAGYQLKRYQLKKADEQYTGDPDNNGPAKVSTSPDSVWGDCEDATDALINPHCKEFYSETSVKYYRLYKNTITCSEDCRPYRRTVDSAMYMAVSVEGESCSRTDVGCREYKGPTANNIRQIFKDDFESGTYNPWIETDGGPLSVSNESVNVYGLSMKVDVETQEVSRLVATQVRQNKSYIVSFWIKGASSVTVTFSSLSASYSATLNADEWQELKSDPFYFENEPASDEKLKIGGWPQAEHYLDNIILKEVQDDVYIIKDSWTTPAACDQDHDGEESPGYMIGCQLYTDTNNYSVYLKSFTHLCSEDKVGCEELIDTHNSTLRVAQVFNDNDLSEITIPADERVYLVNNKENYCQVQDKGCEKVGLPQLSQDDVVVGWTDVYFRNNPDLYDSRPILCKNNDLGCEAYENGIYFKDPELSGKLCEYTTKIINGEKQIGWFKQNTDQPCDFTVEIVTEPEGLPKVEGVLFSDDFTATGLLPRLRSFDLGGIEIKKTGWVGICPATQSGCTEFIAYTQEDIEGESYYYLDNEKLDRFSSCQGKVSLEQGCVLFLDSNYVDADENPVLQWNSVATYKALSAIPGSDSMITPIDCEQTINCDSPDNADTSYCLYCEAYGLTENDTNRILSVRRDRVCGEWLSCLSSRLIWDKASGSYREICELMGRCDKLSITGESPVCANFVYPEEKALTEDIYKDRDVSWYGMDYSGYSIYNIYPIEGLRESEGKLTYKTENVGIGDENTTGRKIPKTCKIYPERDSPFKQGVEEYYTNINVCEDTKDTTGTEKECQGSYTKIEYSLGINKYYDPRSEKENRGEEIPEGICSAVGGSDILSGIKIGDKCYPYDPLAVNGGCGTQGNCVAVSKEVEAIGIEGYCLEPDLSKQEDINACITWWPGRSFSDPSTFEEFTSAGYSAATNRRWYCLEQTTEDGKDGCRYVINITTDGNLTAAWTDRLWSGSTYSTTYGSESTPAASYSNICEPYGVAGVTSPSELVLIGIGDACIQNEANIVYTEQGLKNLFAKAGQKKGRGGGAYETCIGVGWGECSYTETPCFRDSHCPYVDYGWCTDDLKCSQDSTVTCQDDYHCTPTNICESIIPGNCEETTTQSCEIDSECPRTSYEYIDVGGGWDITGDPLASYDPAHEPPQVESITINEGTGDIISTGGSYSSTLEFYAWADKNHMPIRTVLVDWLGTSYTEAEGNNMINGVFDDAMAKNHKTACGGTTDFGSSDAACTAEPFKFERIYLCQGSDSIGWTEFGCSNACCFKPRVKIKDNWEWCTNGIYNCSDNEGWIQYNGLIKVTP